MLLAIDVGNTETKLGLFDNGGPLQQSWRVNTDSKRTADEHGVFFTQLFMTAGVNIADVNGVAIASVVPKLDGTLRSACERYFRCTPDFLEPQTQRLVTIQTDRPSEVGADLVAAAIGGLREYGAPLIIISYGTATVFIAISAERKYLGVSIAPGIVTSIDALIGRTAKLPQISLEAPEHAIGTDTISALQSGIIFGCVGQTEALVSRFREEMAVNARVVATGGLASVIARHTTMIDDVNASLSLVGLQHYFFSKASG